MKTLLTAALVAASFSAQAAHLTCDFPGQPKQLSIFFNEKTGYGTLHYRGETHRVLHMRINLAHSFYFTEGSALIQVDHLGRGRYFPNRDAEVAPTWHSCRIDWTKENK